MSLYDDLSLVYDELFPPNPAARDYLLGIHPGKGPVLDLGCATASLLLDLARAGLPGWGLEPSRAMLDTAARRLSSSGLAPDLLPRLAQGGMLDARRHFPEGGFGLALCLGNTLPHLSGPGELGDFLGVVRDLLGPGASLVLQLLNYDLVVQGLATGGYAFPELSAGGIGFHRSYRRREDGSLDFLTEIVSASGETTRDETRLWPFSPGQVVEALRSAGFGEPLLGPSWAQARGGFRPEADPYLIVTARLPDRGARA